MVTPGCREKMQLKALSLFEVEEVVCRCFGGFAEEPEQINLIVKHDGPLFLHTFT